MTPGYSKLLVHENILPSFQPHPQMTTVDLMMMVKVAAQERTESMFRILLESLGFRVVKFWKNPTAVSSIIEALLPV